MGLPFICPDAGDGRPLSGEEVFPLHRLSGQWWESISGLYTFYEEVFFMKYADIKRAVLSHINQYTMAGSQVAPSYNNQADYLNRIPVLLNEALVNIRTLVKPIPVVLPLTDGEPYGGMIRYELPTDCWTIKTGGVSVIRDGRFRRTNQYRLQGRKYILVPDDGEYTVEYYRYPVQLPLDSTLTDSYEVEEDPEVIQAATYYASAYLVLQEDEFAYATLYNDYESRLGRISPGITAEVQPVEDSYGLNWGYEA